MAVLEGARRGLPKEKIALRATTRLVLGEEEEEEEEEGWGVGVCSGSVVMGVR